MPHVDTAALDQLGSELRGALCLPGSAGYDEACSIWNAAIERRPRAVARCCRADDVAAALAYARRSRLEVSVRGGGHSFAGFALCQDGLMIDLTPMHGVVVDAAARRVTCGGGTTWAQLDAATQEHGLAVPGGFISHTGVAGLTLGGGLGWLSRKAGLSCDNLAGAEVVTADGRVLHASADENADLFWALRGGGGNFGVVTALEFRAVEVGPLIQLGMFFFHVDQGRALLRVAREFTRDLPDDCGAFIAGLNAPPAPFVPPRYQTQPCYVFGLLGTGDAAAHARLVTALRAEIEPLFERVTPMPYAALQRMFDASAPWGVYGYTKAVHLEEMSDGAIDVILEHMPCKASVLSFVPIFVLGGAYARAGEDSVAFGSARRTRFVVDVAAISTSPELLAVDTAWVREFWSALVPYARGGGGHVNFMSEHDEHRVKAAYGEDKYRKLGEIKAKYDPENVFHLNANIPPAR
jgi:FAD/FMN-containing dehydrogenase